MPGVRVSYTRAARVEATDSRRQAIVGPFSWPRLRVQSPLGLPRLPIPLFHRSCFPDSMSPYTACCHAAVQVVNDIVLSPTRWPSGPGALVLDTR